MRCPRRLHASVETVAGDLSAVSTVQSANFTIFDLLSSLEEGRVSVKS